ncbi:MAG: cation:proton antiporter [Thermodesulfobacteriota bacterium]
MEAEIGFLVNLSVSLGLALVLGLVAQRLRLSPIIGYLLAGIALGPHTPGFVADPKMAHDFAEIGVILLMFGVGVHCNFNDLLAVKRIAIPGFIVQILVALSLGIMLAILFGASVGAALVLGISVSIASTVVVIRVLTDSDLLQTSQGYIAIGWLILQDIFTVFVLVALPGIASIGGQSGTGGEGPLITLAWAMAKFAGLTFLVVIIGRRAIPRLLDLVAHTQSRELFILTILSLALAIATGSAAVCGVSMALGAFLAGIIVGQTKVSYQAAADALPMRDAFAVLFFVSVGMFFDPQAILEQPLLLVGFLGIIMFATPFTAFVIIWLFRHPVRTAITVALALAQIGEFSFLVANEAVSLGLLSAGGQSLLISCALLSIAANPPLFRSITHLEQWLRRKERLWRIISYRSTYKPVMIQKEKEEPGQEPLTKYRAVIVGYGPVGRTASRILRNFDIPLLIIDLNLDTVQQLRESGQAAIYGDAGQREILKAAGVERANYLLVTIPDILVRTTVIVTARELNPEIHVFTRARYLKERAWLEEMGAANICIEESETAIGCAMQLLREVGADSNQVQKEIQEIRRSLGM